MSQDFDQLTQYAKAFTGLTKEYENVLKEIAPQITPHLETVTKSFYDQLSGIPETQPFLEGRVESLRSMHTQWLKGIFTKEFDADYTAAMYKIGDVHVKVQLPVEFMSGGMTLINAQLIPLVINLLDDDSKSPLVLCAINAATGFSLFIMQQSFQEASLSEELEKFLKISGMTRVLFSNLADAYKDK